MLTLLIRTAAKSRITFFFKEYLSNRTPPKNFHLMCIQLSWKTDENEHWQLNTDILNNNWQHWCFLLRMVYEKSTPMHFKAQKLSSVVGKFVIFPVFIHCNLHFNLSIRLTQDKVLLTEMTIMYCMVELYVCWWPVTDLRCTEKDLLAYTKEVGHSWAPMFQARLQHAEKCPHKSS